MVASPWVGMPSEVGSFVTAGAASQIVIQWILGVKSEDIGMCGLVGNIGSQRSQRDVHSTRSAYAQPAARRAYFTLLGSSSSSTDNPQIIGSTVKKIPHEK